MFASEQGNAMPFAKWTSYSNGVQSAFIARWPGVIAPGRTSNAMIEYVDVTPTMIDIAGLPPVKKLDGQSFVPVLKGETDKHKDYVYGIQTTRGAAGFKETFGCRTVRNTQYRYILKLSPEVPFNVGITKQETFMSWEEKGKTDSRAKMLADKYIHRPAEELYDDINDPYEQQNLADDPKFVEVKAQLKKKLHEWMDEQGDKGQQTEIEAFDHLLRNLNAAAKGKRGNNAKAERDEE